MTNTKIKTIDIDKFLATRHKIAIVWTTEDVLSVRPDLNEEQAWEVLLIARRYHDATIGLTGSVLEYHAEELFGDAPDDEEA